MENKRHVFTSNIHKRCSVAEKALSPYALKSPLHIFYLVYSQNRHTSITLEKLERKGEKERDSLRSWVGLLLTLHESAGSRWSQREEREGRKGMRLVCVCVQFAGRSMAYAAVMCVSVPRPDKSRG